MKIGIDISQVVHGTGVSKYTEELVINLLRIDNFNKYIFFFSSLRQIIQKNKSLFQANNSEVKNYKLPPTLLEFLWNQFHIIDIEYLIGKIDIFHSSDWIQPPAKAKKVTTVHDVSFLHYPESFPKKIIEVHQRRLRWVKKECDLIIADSKSTKEDLINLLGFKEHNIRVIYLGVNKLNVFNSNQDKRKDYLLYIGTLQPRKNLLSLIRAFEAIRSLRGLEKIKLIIAGKKGWSYDELFGEVKRLKLQNKIIFKGFVSEKEKWLLLDNALVFIYPSLYEGFGLPVLEAMSIGCPVITSNNSSLSEITDKSALLVDPLKIDEIALAIKTLIINPNLRRQLSERGKKQAAKFTWRKTAQETLAVYKELYDHRD